MLVFASAIALAALPVRAMEFNYVQKGHNIVVGMFGRILPGDFDKFASFLQTIEGLGSITMFILDSPGGYIRDAGKISNIIQQSGAATGVGDNGKCLSACILLFTAASEGARYYMGNPFVGVHSASNKKIRRIFLQ
jgi:hypothetical protein